jgi:hypothetical protein
MAFKLTVEISDDGETLVNIDGMTNHLLVLGLLDSIRFNILTAAAQAEAVAQQAAPGEVNVPGQG